MQILMLLSLILTVIIIVHTSRTRRDRNLLTEEVRQRGGDPVRIQKIRKGHPFPDTGRGWWAWRIIWRGAGEERTAYALTTREGLKEWRD